MIRPTQPYFWGIAIFSLQIFFWMAEQAFPQWYPAGWAKMPWNYLMLLTAGFLIGLVVNDLYNPHSVMMYRYKHKNRLFDLKKAYVTCTDLSDDGYMALAVEIGFVQNLRHADIFLHVYPNIQNGRCAAQNFTLHLDRNVLIPKDKVLKRVIAVIPRNIKSSESPWWGAITTTEKKVILNGSRNVAELKIRSGNLCQTRKFFIEMLSRDAGTNGRFYFLDEEEDKFKVEVEI